MSEKEKTKPKVFISYSQAIQDRVIEFAKRLRQDGVETITDFFDLKPGNDIHAFMERLAADPTIDYALIICDKTYTEKANQRKGGVGKETTIYAPLVYGNSNQEKVIPIIFEKDENGEAFCPVCLKNLVYIDLSDVAHFDQNYEELLRHVYQQPRYRKTELGEMPQRLKNVIVDLSSLRDVVKQIQDFSNNKRKMEKYLVKKATEAFISSIKHFSFSDRADIAIAMPALIVQSLEYRDLFLDFCRGMIFNDFNLEDALVKFLEDIYNEFHNATEDTSVTDAIIEFREFVIWEFFVDMTALLLYYEQYDSLHKILLHTYYLRSYPKGNHFTFRNYFAFRSYCSIIEDISNPRCNKPKLFTYSGDMLVKRCNSPELTRTSLANADVVLFQLGDVFTKKEADEFRKDCWFPTCYIYLPSSNNQAIWQKMRSESYCRRIAPLFGVSSVDEIKATLKNVQQKCDMKYPGSFDFAPCIFSSIRYSDIGTLP